MKSWKNAKDLSPNEKEKYCEALLELKGTTKSGHELNQYDEFVALHLGVTGRLRNGVDIGDGAHWAAGFFPWHREYLDRFEKAMRGIDPDVSLPYWDWSSGDETDTTGIFTDDFMGPPGDSSSDNRITSGYFADWEVDPRLDSGGRGNVLVREPDLLDASKLSSISSIGERAQDAVNNTHDFETFRSRLEGAHGSIHVWVGGHMSVMTSPNDPIFFLHHANIDRLWSKWQEIHPGPDNYNPEGAGTYGHKLDDRMWPWDGAEGTTTTRTTTDTGKPLQELLPTYSDYDVVTPRHVLDHNLAVPVPVRQFLTDVLTVRNLTTGSDLTRYKIIGSVPDKFAASRGFLGQTLTTVGYEDRVGRPESDYDFIDVILEISHTDAKVNSARGVQLGGDIIEVLLNGISRGTLARTSEIM